MELIDKRKVDDLGRVVLPSEIRKKLYLNTGSTIEIYRDGETAVLKKGHASCIFCQSETELFEFCGHNVCRECRNKIQNEDDRAT